MNIVVKNEGQINGIRKSCKLAAETLQYLKDYVKEGVSTNELDSLAEEYIKKNKGIPAVFGYLNYPKNTCISVNEVICHGVPSDYKLKNGDILNIDIVVNIDGYYGDTGIMYSVGEISSEAKSLLSITKNCLNIGIDQVKDNNYYMNIGYFINKYIINYNIKNNFNKSFSIVSEYCGHGVGLNIHEDPLISHINTAKDYGFKMKKGHIFTIEPMICVGESLNYIDESDKWSVKTKNSNLSAQYEHTVLVTNSGFEILTIV